MKASTAMVISKGYTDDTADEFGAVKGASCQISKIDYDASGNTVIDFLWQNSAGATQTSQAIINKGRDADLTNLKEGKNIIIKDNGDGTITISASGEMSIDYTKVTNKPSINGVELDGNKTTADLKIESGKIDVIKVDGTILPITDKTVNIDLSGKVDKETGKSLVADTDITQITTNKNAIATLNGDDKTEGSVDKKIADAVGDITQFDTKVVDELPTKGEKGIIYFVPKKDSTAPDIHDEYIWVGDKFELVGSTKVDLSEYAKSEDVVAIQQKVADRINETDTRLETLSYNEIAGGKNLANDILFDESKYILRDTTWSYIDVSGILARKKFTASMKDNPNLSELNCGFGTDSTVDPVVANRFITSGNIKSVTYDFSTSDKVYLFVATAGGYISTKLNKMLNALSTRLQVEIGDTATDYEQHIKSNATLTNEITRKEIELAELKMLGWTVPSECPIQNTVSGNTFTQRVGRVDLGALNWGINAYATPTAFSLHENVDLPDLVSVSDNKDEKVRCYSSNYDSDSASKVTGTTRTYTFCVITGKRLYVRADVTTAEELKAELKGKYIYYELDTPITKAIDGNEVRQSSGGNIYSEEETICGTWIDGKSVCRKVIILPSDISVGSSWVSSTITKESISPSVIIKAYGITTDSQMYHLNVLWSGDYINVMNTRTNPSILIKTIILEYVKA